MLCPPEATVNLRHLEVFREVMLAESVSKAARNLGRTQPAVSATIANLERDIGYDLFERKNGRLHPVPEAHYLLVETEEIIGRMGALERSMKEASGIETKQLRIACMPIIAEFFLPRLIARFAGQHASARFFLAAHSSILVYERMAAQQFDVGLAERGPESDLVNEEPIEGDCLCALPASDPLAAQPFITPADLAGRSCATFLPDHYIARRLREIFAEAGVPLDVRFELQNAAAQYQLISAGVAFGVLSPLNAWIHRHILQHPETIRFVPMKPAIPYRFAILTPAHRTQSRLAQAFVAELRSELADVLGQVASRGK